MNFRNFRICNTIAEIEEYDNFDRHHELFIKGIETLKKYLNTTDDFSDEDRELLEDVFTIMELNG